MKKETIIEMYVNVIKVSIESVKKEIFKKVLLKISDIETINNYEWRNNWTIEKGEIKDDEK